MARSEKAFGAEDLVVQTRLQRDEAEALLASLVSAKLQSEKNLAALGQSDILRSVTGRSSIDNAIESTRRMVASFDRVLIDLRSGLSDEELELLGQAEQAARSSRRAS